MDIQVARERMVQVRERPLIDPRGSLLRFNERHLRREGENRVPSRAKEENGYTSVP